MVFTATFRHWAYAKSDIYSDESGTQESRKISFLLFESGIQEGAEFLGRCKSSDISERRYCTKCGGQIMVDHPTLGLIDVRLGALPNFPFEPTVHLNYGETIFPMRDGLPKLKDFPETIGGSGETLPE